MEIKGVIWWTFGYRCFGIVYGETKYNSERKAYFGQVSGKDEPTDIKSIAEHGTPVDPSQIKTLNDFLNPPAPSVAAEAD